MTTRPFRGHVKNILADLSVHDRTEAVAVAIRRGIVHLDYALPLISGMPVQPQKVARIPTGLGVASTATSHILNLGPNTKHAGVRDERRIVQNERPAGRPQAPGGARRFWTGANGFVLQQWKRRLCHCVFHRSLGTHQPTTAVLGAYEALPTDAVSPLFEMALEATEEAVYNSLLRATTVRSRFGTAEAMRKLCRSKR